MSLKLLTQLSHFITMIFGIALGMSLCMLYQYQVNLFISDLSPLIVGITFLGIILRIYTHIVWNNKKYKFHDIFKNFDWFKLFQNFFIQNFKLKCLCWIAFLHADTKWISLDYIYPFWYLVAIFVYRKMSLMSPN